MKVRVVSLARETPTGPPLHPDARPPGHRYFKNTDFLKTPSKNEGAGFVCAEHLAHQGNKNQLRGTQSP